MTTVTLTLVHRCAGGAHLTFELTGAKSLQMKDDRSNFATPITNDEWHAWLKVTVKAIMIDKTPAQALAALEAGVVITV